MNDRTKGNVVAFPLSKLSDAASDVELRESIKGLADLMVSNHREYAEALFGVDGVEQDLRRLVLGAHAILMDMREKRSGRVPKKTRYPSLPA